MEKISQILPATSRIRSTDVGSSLPVRPGAPGFGRLAGRSEPSVRKMPLSAVDGIQGLEQGRRTGPDDGRDVAIADQIADRFFESKSAGLKGERKNSAGTGGQTQAGSASDIQKDEVLNPENRFSRYA